MRCLACFLTAALAAALGACDGEKSPVVPDAGPVDAGPADACAGVTCGAAERCEPTTGSCVSVCLSTSCERGMSCDPADGLCKCGAWVCAEGFVCEAGSCNQVLADRCSTGSGWSPAIQAFREATADWGLDSLGVEGVRISVTDFDGDGLADLSVRRASNKGDDFSAGGARATWLLRNEGGRTFSDVTQASGLVLPRRITAPEAGRPMEIVAWADVDNDGDLDAFSGLSSADIEAIPAESSELMLNRGDGTFALGPDSNPFRREGTTAPLAAASFVDYDRDGQIDLWLGYGAVSGFTPQQDQLFHSYGAGYFEEATLEAGLHTERWSTQGALNEGRANSYAWAVAACDLNDDGLPELLASSYGRAPNLLWQGGTSAEGAPLYANRSIASGYAFDERTDWSDNESARCWCKLHPADEDCAGVPAPALIQCRTDEDAFRWNHAADRQPYRLGGNSGTTVCADVNNDGALDLLTTEIVHWDVGSSSDPSELLLNSGEPQVRFVRPGNEVTGLAREHDRIDWNDGDITAAVFDFDNDARPDVYIGSTDYPGTRGHLFWQKPDGSFEPVPIALGIDHRASHGIAVADFDRDGDLDVVVGHSRARCPGDQCYATANARYFENVVGQDGNWIQLKLEGARGTNRSAIGARVSVSAGSVTQTQEVGGGHGHYGIQHDMVLHFGLGAACEAEVTVRWPAQDLPVQQLRLKAGYRYKLVQGEKPMALLDD